MVSSVEVGAPAFAIKNEGDAQHIARHDPARVLEQTPILRAVVELIEGMVSVSQQSEAERSVLYPLAAVWSDHPDYRPEWAIGGGGSTT